MMEDEGRFEDAVVVPGTDEHKAKAALHGIATVALNVKTPLKERINALKILLDFTKERPAQKQKVQIDKSEEWLLAVEADLKNEQARSPKKTSE